MLLVVRSRLLRFLTLGLYHGANLRCNSKPNSHPNLEVIKELNIFGLL